MRVEEQYQNITVAELTDLAAKEFEQKLLGAEQTVTENENNHGASETKEEHYATTVMQEAQSKVLDETTN